MEAQEAIRSRRSIRHYQATAVDDKTLELVLEAARQAPSWDNTQCWQFIVVRDAGNRNKLADMLPRTNPATKAIREAPVVIVACAELGKAGYLGGKLSSDKGDWYMFDVALAMQNLVLAAQSLGLGTVYIGWFDEEKTASFLGVPEGYRVLAMTPLGYPDQHPRARPRKKLAEIVSYEKFGLR
jgi:nitroreductase